MKGRKIDLATANDALILDTFDLMATYGCARDTICLLYTSDLPTICSV